MVSKDFREAYDTRLPVCQDLRHCGLLTLDTSVHKNSRYSRFPRLLNAGGRRVIINIIADDHCRFCRNGGIKGFGLLRSVTLGSFDSDLVSFLFCIAHNDGFLLSGKACLRGQYKINLSADSCRSFGYRRLDG